MEAEQKTTEAHWRQAIAPGLLRRLLRPVECPGVIRSEFVRAKLAAFKRMTGGLPLLEKMFRYLQWNEFPITGLPIVHALPPKPHPDARRVPAGNMGVARKTVVQALSRRVSLRSSPSGEQAGQRGERKVVRPRATQSTAALVADPSIGLSQAPVGPSISVLSSSAPEPQRIVLPPGRRRRREDFEATPASGDSSDHIVGHPTIPVPITPLSPLLVRKTADTASTPRNAVDGRRPLAAENVLNSTPWTPVFPVVRVANVDRYAPQGRPPQLRPNIRVSPAKQRGDESLCVLPANDNRWSPATSLVHPANKDKPGPAEVNRDIGGAAQEFSHRGEVSVPRMTHQLQGAFDIEGPHRRFSTPPAAAIPGEDERIAFDDLVDRTLRKLMRNLDIDRERKGWRS